MYLKDNFLRKHKDNPEKLKQYQKIWWYSIPVVYPDWQDQFKQLARAGNARRAKKYRTFKYLKGMQELYNQMWFLTLTFTDEVLERTSEETRKRYVQRFLNAYTRDYYANQDFGTKNGREHYHAVIAMPYGFEGDHLQAKELLPWQYGFLSIKPMRDTNGDVGRVTTYLNKLSNHANKVGTGKSLHKRAGFRELDPGKELPF